MPRVDVEIRGTDELLRTLDDPQLTGALIAAVIERATHEAQEAAQSVAPEIAVRSLVVELTPTLGRLYSTLPPIAALSLEGGRRAGTAMPPTQAIAAWAAERGIDETAAFPIARAIARRGVRGRFFMRKARAQVERILPQLLQDAGAEIVARWRAPR